MIHREELVRIRSIMIENSEDYKAELDALPEGELFCSDNRGRKLYYERFPKKGNSVAASAA